MVVPTPCQGAEVWSPARRMSRGYGEVMDEPVPADVARAVEAARESAGAPADATVAWRVVTRLDERPPYLLVGFSSADAGCVVAVSLAGEVHGRGSDPKGADAWWVHAREELVWAPGTWSRSPLYPLRRTVIGDEVAYLDHDGQRVALWPGTRG